MRLRGVTIQNEKHRHTPLSESLYGSYLEHERLRSVTAAQAMAKAALASHADIDVEQAIDMVDNLLFSMRAMVPYMTGGRTRSDELKEERQQAIDQYHEYLINTLGEEKYHEFLKEQLGEEEYVKFIEGRTDG